MINYNDAIIYPSDLELLDSRSEWLNDAGKSVLVFFKSYSVSI